MAGVDLALEPGDGLGPVAGGRVEQAERGAGRGASGRSAIRCIRVAATRGTQARRRQGRAASSRTSNRSLGTARVAWPTPGLAVLVGDPDRQPAGGHGVELQLLDQPLEVADQPGVEDHRVGGRLAEAAAPREHLVQRAARGGSAARGRR